MNNRGGKLDPSNYTIAHNYWAIGTKVLIDGITYTVDGLCKVKMKE